MHEASVFEGALPQQLQDLEVLGDILVRLCRSEERPYESLMLQIIAPEQDKYIKRTPDGTPMEVALTQDLDHPNIVRTLRHASFQSQVSLLPLLFIIQFRCNPDVAQMETDKQRHVTTVCTVVLSHAISVSYWL